MSSSVGKQRSALREVDWQEEHGGTPEYKSKRDIAGFASDTQRDIARFAHDTRYEADDTAEALATKTSTTSTTYYADANGNIKKDPKEKAKVRAFAFWMRNFSIMKYKYFNN